MLDEASPAPRVRVGGGCGPPRLVEAVEACALARGVPAERIFSEQVEQPRPR